MRFSLNFVKEFLEVDVLAKELASLLTMSGIEVEHFQAEGNDWVFDIEVTTNRYDWLSIIGISREIASCLHQKLKIKYPKIKRTRLLKEKKIIIEDRNDCSFYVGSMIKGVTVNSSPSWLSQRVQHCSVNSINNIVDITNYCMLKWGNPLHAFDADKIEGDIYIRRAKTDESFVGIDDKERKLNKDNLVIADNRKVIALAGVIGAKNTEVDERTKNIFLEAAVFSPLTVRRSRRAAGIDTDSSYRFERRVSADYLEYAVGCAVQLIEKVGSGQFMGICAGGSKSSLKNKKITISLSKLNDYLGEIFSNSRVKSILSNLDFDVKEISRDKLTVRAPSFRFDVNREVDVYEEFSRVYGYNNITPSIPFLRNQIQDDQMYKFKNHLRRILPLLGLREIVTVGIDGEQNLTKLEQKKCITIVNPLKQQDNALRTTLLSGMIKSIKHNLNRDQHNVKFFEIANIYFKDKNGYCEEPVLSMGTSGFREDFFRLKGVIEGLLKYLNIEDINFIDKGKPNFTNALRVVSGQKEIGFLGKLDKKIGEAFDLKEEVYFSSLDINFLKKLHKQKSINRLAHTPLYREI
ncbi:MAG: phenylalanine--tRNA ligase subunit beta [Candidatus Omnitrophota bacterium]